MSIACRLQDAKILYDLGRYEGALLSVLIAVGASSRRRFPQKTPSRRNPGKDMGDGEAFETFMAEEMLRVGVCSVWFNGRCNSAETVFYKHLRNNLAHEAGLPEQIIFRAGPCHNQAEIRRESGPPERLVVTHPIVLLIGYVVSTAAENADVPDEVKRSLCPCWISKLNLQAVEIGIGGVLVEWRRPRVKQVAPGRLQRQHMFDLRTSVCSPGSDSRAILPLFV
jgi:hypothetical protein